MAIPAHIMFSASEVLGAASDQVVAFLAGGPPHDFQRALLSRARTGVAVDLLLPRSEVMGLELTHQYFQHLEAAGGRLFLLDLAPDDWQQLQLARCHQLWIDQRQALVFERTKKRFLSLSTELEARPFARRLQRLYALAYQASPAALAQYLAPRPQPVILPRFSADSMTVRAGGNVRLGWSAPGAERVSLEPDLGEAAATGSVLLRIDAPSTFDLRVDYGAEVVVRKSLSIALAAQPGLDYWLTVADPHGGPASVVAASSPDFPHHYGMIQGQALTLHWRTRAVDRLSLNDVDLSLPHGALPLAQEEELTLRLVATGAGTTVEQTIYVRAFVPPELPVQVLAVRSPALPAIQFPELPEVVDSASLLGALPPEMEQELRARWAASEARWNRTPWWLSLLKKTFP
ncbi:hypothetical protein QWY85_08875 [Neolewinella lacunae]|uniref:Uncharacterized protein n=1 Tax=Neolewinella lacunae TaxID=1517758 RepID=A0A923PPU7_9BACT|nr:hypothetical protein [Neolewinella lacunae]MBC6996666.1 hypothetical protein [Neolewinella lacunae]MDN3634769.1 hypothetical protein [Neolewinella lacunae]